MNMEDLGREAIVVCRSERGRHIALIVAALLLFTARGTHGQDQITLSGQTELARLVDLCAERLGLSITYDASLLKGTATVRGSGDLSDTDLWEMTCRLLAERGFTTVRFPESRPTSLSVVKIAEAAALARIEDTPASPDERFQPGYVSRTLRINHQAIKSIIDTVKTMSSKSGGQVMDLGSGNLILISDLRPRVEEIIRLIASLDVEGTPPHIRRVTTRFVSSAQLASQMVAASAASDAIAATPKKGKVISTPEPDALLIICPSQEIEYWLSLVDRFDQRQAVMVKNYAIAHLPVTEVVRLIEQAGRDPSPRGSGDQWRLVHDDLTGSLFITATSTEHERVEEIMTRLASMPVETRRPMRVFVIRNRSVREITEVILRLMDAGVLDSSTEAPSFDRHQIPPSGAPALAIPPGSMTPRPSDTALSSRGVHSMPDVSSNDHRVLTGAQLQRPALTLTADEGTNTLIAVADSRLLNQLAELIRTLDVRQAQVMIEVLIVSLNDNDTLDLGVELRKIELSGATTISLSSLFGLGTSGVGPPPAASTQARVLLAWC